MNKKQLTVGFSILIIFGLMALFFTLSRSLKISKNITASNKIDKRKFENVYRCAKAFEGASAVGLNYQKFLELLQNFSTEISITADRITDEKEKELLKIYSEALIIYKDSETLWKSEIEQESTYGEGMPSKAIFVNKEVYAIVEKYKFPTKDWRVGYWNEGRIVSETSIQTLWEMAGEKAEQANLLLNK